MVKLKIKIVRLGSIQELINYKIIKKHKSPIFNIIDGVDDFPLPNTDNGYDYSTYSEKQIYDIIPSPKTYDADVVVAITNCILPGNFYAKPLGNKAVFSFKHISRFFKSEHIPLENVILKMLYEYSLGYNREQSDFSNKLLHDETRKCLFDMNGILEDVIHSFDSPQICDECKHNLREMHIPINLIKQVDAKIGRLKKRRFYRILDFVKRHPVISIIISSIYAVLLGMLGSYLYDILKLYIGI